MGTLALTLPTIGQPNATEDVKIPNALTAIQTFVNGANVADTQLESPTNPVWRPILAPNCLLNGVTAASTWYFSTNGAIASGGAGAATAQGLWLAPSSSDVAVASKTTRLRVRVPYIVNGVAPGITITWGLYPVNSSAGSGTIILTLGTVVAGSTAAAVTPSLGSTAQVTSAGFDFSTLGAGAYIFGVAASGSQTANSLVMSQPILEMRHT